MNQFIATPPPTEIRKRMTENGHKRPLEEDTPATYMQPQKKARLTEITEEPELVEGAATSTYPTKAQCVAKAGNTESSVWVIDNYVAGMGPKFEAALRPFFGRLESIKREMKNGRQYPVGFLWGGPMKKQDARTGKEVEFVRLIVDQKEELTATQCNDMVMQVIGGGYELLWPLGTDTALGYFHVPWLGKLGYAVNELRGQVKNQWSVGFPTSPDPQNYGFIGDSVRAKVNYDPECKLWQDMKKREGKKENPMYVNDLQVRFPDVNGNMVTYLFQKAAHMEVLEQGPRPSGHVIVV